MASDAQITARLEFRVREAEKQLANATKAIERNFSAIEKGAARSRQAVERNMTASASAMEAAVTRFRAAAAGISAGMLAGQALKYAESWTKARNVLVSANVPLGEQGAILDRLFQQAQQYGVALNAQVDLYGSLGRAAKSLGADQEQLFKFTEAVAASLKVDGKSAQEASGALMQLGQALRSTNIQAEEYNSLIDGAPALLEAVAAGIKRFEGDVGRLTVAVKNGEVTNREFFQGAIDGSKILKERLGNSIETVDGALVKLDNALTAYIGKLDQTHGVSTSAANAISWLADKVEMFGRAIETYYGPVGNFIDRLGRLGNVFANLVGLDAPGRMAKSLKGMAAELEAIGREVASGEIEIPAATMESLKQWNAEVQAGTRSVLSMKQALEDLPDDAFGRPDTKKRIGGFLDAYLSARNQIAADAGAGANTPGEMAYRPRPPYAKIATPPANAKGGKAAASPRASGPAAAAVDEDAAAIDASIAAIERRTQALRNEMEVKRLSGEAAYLRQAELEMEAVAAERGMEVNQVLRDRITLAAMGFAQQQMLNDEFERANEQARQAAEEQAARQQEVNATMESFGREAASALFGVLTGAQSAGEAFSQLALRIAEAVFQAMILKALGLDSGGSGGGGGGIGSLIGNLIGDALNGLFKAKTGGLVRGPGTGTSDSIPARLSDGEYVVRASAVPGNRKLLDAINNGSMQRFADGGIVGAPTLPNYGAMRIPAIPDVRPAGRTARPNVHVHQAITVSGNGDAVLKEAMRRAAAEGAAKGYQMSMRDVPARVQQYQRNGS